MAKPPDASRFEAHAFEEPGDSSDRCARCGERRSQIRHHPTRVHAADLLHDAPPMSDDERAQYERAHQSWELVVLDAPDSGVLKSLRKTLRVKRSELPAFAASLPGTVRRGAQIDLAPLEALLREAGVRCELRRSTGGGDA